MYLIANIRSTDRGINVRKINKGNIFSFCFAFFFTSNSSVSLLNKTSITFFASLQTFEHRFPSGFYKVQRKKCILNVSYMVHGTVQVA